MQIPQAISDFLPWSGLAAPLRWTMISIAEVAILFTIGLLLQTMRPARVAVRMFLPYAALVLLPYSYAALRLRSAPADAGTLALLIVIAIAIVAFIVFTFWFLFFRISPFVAILALPAYLPLSIFSLSQLALVIACVHALADTGALLRALGAGILPVVLCAAVFALIGYPLVRWTERLRMRTGYSISIAQQHQLNVFRGLWERAGPGAVNGFPRDQAEVVAMGPPAWDPAFAPDGSREGTAYDFRYLPAAPDADGRVRGFRIVTRKRVPRRTFTESFSVDQDGVLRRSNLDWASPQDRIEYETSLGFATFVGMCDAFHELHGCYPRRLQMPRDRTTPPEAMRLPYNSYVAPERLEVRPDGATIIREAGDVETITYLPDEPGGERPVAYRAWYRARRRSVGDLRSYCIDEAGAVHATAEDRAATADDPVVVSAEFDRRRADGKKWALEWLQMAHA